MARKLVTSPYTASNKNGEEVYPLGNITSSSITPEGGSVQPIGSLHFSQRFMLGQGDTVTWAGGSARWGCNDNPKN